MADIQEKPVLDAIYSQQPHFYYVGEGAINSTIKVGDREIVAPSVVNLPEREDWAANLKKPLPPAQS
jgi:hypothetical protein